MAMRDAHRAVRDERARVGQRLPLTLVCGTLDRLQLTLVVDDQPASEPTICSLSHLPRRSSAAARRSIFAALPLIAQGGSAVSGATGPTFARNYDRTRWRCL